MQTFNDKLTYHHKATIDPQNTLKNNIEYLNRHHPLPSTEHG